MMAGHLLLVVLIYSFHEIKAQALRPPKLIVNPQMITETDLVTLHCQTPTSVSECFFHINGRTAKRFFCLKTLTGTELLEITNQSPPANVQVICYYVLRNQSPDSDVSSIYIQTSLTPKLTVSPSAVHEIDTVTLKCQTPPSVSVSHCYFYILNGGTVKVPSCLGTLTGAELLRMVHQSPPAEVEVKCYYTVKLSWTNSPHSDSSSITIYSLTPQMTHQYFDGEYVLFNCSPPGSANHDTRCNLYFGEASSPVKTATIWKRGTSTKQKFCVFIVPIDDLLRKLHFVQRKDASCDTLGSEANSLSPRSDGLSLTYIVEIESSKMQTTPTPTTTGLIVNTPHASTPLTPTQSTSGWTTGSSTVHPSSTLPTSVKLTSGSSVNESDTTESPPSSGTWIWMVVAVAGCGVTVGVILLVSAIIWNHRRAGSKELKTREPQNKDSNTGRVYYEISEEPTALALRDMVYSTVDAH